MLDMFDAGICSFEPIYNQENNRYYQLLSEKQTFTFKEAIKIQQYHNGIKGQLLTINDDNELKFIVEKIAIQSAVIKDVWLSAIPLDKTQTSWTWASGIYRQQPLYTSFPPQCYGYCANWRVSTNLTTPYVWFNARELPQSRQWLQTDEFDRKLVILEYESTIDPIISRSDPGTTTLTISNLPATTKDKSDQQWSVNINNNIPCTIYNQSTSPSSSPPSNNITTINCNFEKLKSYEGIFNITITNSTSSSFSFSYRFNAPWIKAVKVNSGNSTNPSKITLYTINFVNNNTDSNVDSNDSNFKNSTTIYVNNVQFQINSFNFTTYPQTIELISTLSITPNTQIWPIQVSYKTAGDNYHYYVNQYESDLAIYEPSTGLYYHSFNQPTTIDNAIQYASADHLFYSYGHLSNINTNQLFVFSLQQFYGSNKLFKSWTDLKLLGNDDIYYNGKPYQTELGNVTLNGLNSSDHIAFYFNGPTQSYYSLNTSSDGGFLFPFVVVYGILEPLVNTDIPIPTVQSVNGTGTYQINMKSNFYWFNHNITLRLNNTAISNGKGVTIDLPSKTIQFQSSPIGSGEDQSLEILISNLDNINLSFKIKLYINFPVPKLFGVKGKSNAPIVILGEHFVEPIKVNGMKCSLVYFEFYRDSNSFNCILEESPIGLTFNVDVNDQISNNYTITTPYAWINSVSPFFLPYDGAVLTISGSNLGNQNALPLITLRGLETINCTNVTFITPNTNLTCTTDSVTQGGQYTIEIQQRNQLQNIAATVNFVNLEITGIYQNQFTATISGSWMHLYKDSWIIKIGQTQSPKNINCSDETGHSCTFEFVSGCMNGLVTIINKNTGRTLYSENSRVWDPLILNVTPTSIIDPANHPFITIGGLFFSKTVSAIRLDGYEIKDINITSENEVTVGSLPIAAGKIQVTTKDIKYGPEAPIYSNTLLIRYPKPSISNVSTSTYYDIVNITIVGNHLGFSNQSLYPGLHKATPKIYGISTEPFEPSFYSPNQIIIDRAPLDSRSGVTFNISIDDQFTEIKFPIKIKPFIQTSSKPPTIGGYITISGYYLSPYTWSGEQILFVSIGNTSVDIPCVDPNLLNQTSTVQYQLLCKAPIGSGRKTLYIRYSDNDRASIDLDYQPPTISSTTSTLYGREGRVTIFGNNFANTNIYITIGGVECFNPRVNENFNILDCVFPSNVSINKASSMMDNNSLQPYVNDLSNLASDITLEVFVEIDGINTTSPTFIYSVQPLECQYQCAHGFCMDGHCHCEAGYTGLDCALIVVDDQIDTPQPLNNTIDLLLGSDEYLVGFNVSIVGLLELDPTNTIIREIPFNNNEEVNWIQTNNYNSNGLQDQQDQQDQSSIYYYYTSIPGIATVRVNLTVFLESASYNFLGDIFQVANNSIKYQIEIDQYNFTSPLNSLKLLILTNPTDGDDITIDDKCNTVKVKSYKNQKGSLRELAMTNTGGNGLLKAFYSDRMLLDDRLEYSQVDVGVRSLLGNATKINYNVSLGVLTSITIPYHSQSVVIDPSYQVLIIIPDQTCNDQVKSWHFPLILTLILFGVFSIIAIILLVLYQKFKYHLKIFWQGLTEWHSEMVELIDIFDD